MALIVFLSSVLVLQFNPSQKKQQGRDNVRISNVIEIERVINEYFLDNYKYPGDANKLYQSNGTNWIPVTNLTKYAPFLPTDPDNNKYYYMHDGRSYEINSTFEFYKDKMKNDNGNNINVYETGTNLNLIN